MIFLSHLAIPTLFCVLEMNGNIVIRKCPNTLLTHQRDQDRFPEGTIGTLCVPCDFNLFKFNVPCGPIEGLDIRPGR